MTFNINFHLPSGWSKNRPMKWFSSHAHGKVSRNKAWEWQSDYFGWTSLFNLQLDLIPTGQSHAGVGISLTLLGFMIDAKIYDGRHWDYDNNTWEVYEPEEERDYEAEALRKAYFLVAQDIEHKSKLEREAFLETPEGQAEVLAERERLKEEKRLRGEAYRAANLAKAQNNV